MRKTGLFFNKRVTDIRSHRIIPAKNVKIREKRSYVSITNLSNRLRSACRRAG